MTTNNNIYIISLYIIHLILFTTMLLKHERDNMHCTVTQNQRTSREKLPLQHFCAGYERNLAII